MEIIGTIKVIGEPQVVSDKFKKRDVVITTVEQYPQHITIQFTQDKCDLLNAYKVGQEVTIGINIRGREWTSPSGEVKHFNTIEGWFIKALNQEQTTEPQPQATNSTTVESDEEQNLPF